MNVVAYGALLLAQAGGADGQLRLPAAMNCVAVPVLMSAPGGVDARRTVRSRPGRPILRPAQRCVRLSAR
jgi:hypothetical protein